ncbi:hypothetical protein ABPG72_004733 [Tetrahymena utriculariae]
MNYIREIVSGKKKRMKDAGYNLDLSYICPRIIGMSFPAEGLEITFRNNIKDVVQFIKERHGNDFHIYNLSGRSYQKEKFNGQVSDFPWEDHHSPPINILFMMCKHIDDFLSNKLANVVFVHCLAGKGRTGTAICCYLIYSGRFQTAEDALTYYAKKRFQVGGGVTQPSQKRYVKYFEQIIKGPPITPVLKYITSLTLVGIPIFSKHSCRPYIEIYNVKENKLQLIYTDKKSHSEQKKFTDLGNKELNIIKLQILTPFVVIGDVLIRVIHNGKFKNIFMFRFAFNTAFIPEDNTLTFELKELDPDKVIKDQRFPDYFYCEVKFTDYCKCKNTTLFNNKCKDCLKFMPEVKNQWDTIHEIMEEYKQHSIHESKIILFGDPEFDDQNEVLYSIKNPQILPEDFQYQDDEDDFDCDDIEYEHQLGKITEKHEKEDDDQHEQHNKKHRDTFFKHTM